MGRAIVNKHKGRKNEKATILMPHINSYQKLKCKKEYYAYNWIKNIIRMLKCIQ